jgi:hypothetical protein
MLHAEDIRKTILKVAEEYGPEKSFWPSDVARKIDHENWRGLIPHVTIVADVMIKEGQIILTRPNGPLQLKKTT